MPAGPQLLPPTRNSVLPSTSPHHHHSTLPQEMGLAFDEWDLDYYTKLFK
jgi:hypothetical protein